jgi:molybdopterin-containing oxidoreductase family iron-sulfur binding subunit
MTTIGVAGGASVRALASSPGDGSGTRLAMVVDLRKFDKDGALAKRCIEACHRAHNVPAHTRPKDQIKWIWTEDFETAFHEQELQLVRSDLEGKQTLLLCNHCDNPPCTRVCPTRATWKREEDGLVMMDWHRCIGCRYCVVACPYGSRSFNWVDPRSAHNLDDPGELEPTFPTRMRGVVEKCNFCEERLAKGELPACVEACDDDELIFGDLNDEHGKVRAMLEQHFTIRRKPVLGTHPEVYYIVDRPQAATPAVQEPGVVVDESEVKGGDHA